ncbi:MAG: FtsX-like permease family protein [Candidatus Bathyarchaeota archaeon]|nr:FtsX-like permease family protein [Candidatus Bathyarchaeota archaeon]
MGILSRAARNVSKRKTRSLLVIMVLSFAFAMIVSIPPSITASEAATQKTIDSLTENAQSVNETMSNVATQIDCHMPEVRVPNAGPNNQTLRVYPLMNMTDYSNLTRIDHVAAVIPILDLPVNDSDCVFNVFGMPLDNASLGDMYSQLLPSNITEGRNLQVGDSGVVVLQERVAQHFNISVGETVKIVNQTFCMVGIDGYSPVNKTAAYMTLNDAWAVTNNTGNVTGFRVFADSVYNVEAAAGKISVMYPALTVSISASLVYSIIQMQSQTNVQLETAKAVMSQIQSTGMMEIGIVTVVAGAIVLFIMLYTVRERTREIGTLKALGAGSLSILGQFMLEGILLSLIAGVVGIVIGTFGATSFANLLLPAPAQAGNSTVTPTDASIDAASSASISITITPELVLFGLGVAVLLGALGSLYPAWRAARTRPAEAMRYE